MEPLPAVTRRLGGGFGGKLNSVARVAGFAAMAASRLGERVSCAISRDDDLRMHGGEALPEHSDQLIMRQFFLSGLQINP